MWEAAGRDGLGPCCTRRSRWEKRELLYCTPVQPSGPEKKGVLEAMSNSGHSPGCGHNEQGTPQSNHHGDVRR